MTCCYSENRPSQLDRIFFIVFLLYKLQLALTALIMSYAAVFTKKLLKPDVAPR